MSDMLPHALCSCHLGQCSPYICECNPRLSELQYRQMKKLRLSRAETNRIIAWGGNERKPGKVIPMERRK